MPRTKASTKNSVDAEQVQNLDVTNEETEQIQDLDFANVETEPVNQEPEEKLTPLPTEPEWHDYVMSHFIADELVDGCPTADGLRRVCEKLVGAISEVTPTVVQTPDQTNGERATVVVTISVNHYDGRHSLVGDAVDCFRGNLDGKFAVFPVATAVTRAEARALRKILRLRKIVSAEEKLTEPVDPNATFVPENTRNSEITNQQESVIKTLLPRAGVVLDKLLQAGSRKVSSVQQLTFDEAANLIGSLNKYIQDPSSIPGEFKI